MQLLQRVRDVGIRRHLAKVTIECYQLWIEQFLRFCRVDWSWRHSAQHQRDVLRDAGYVPLADSLRHNAPYA